MVIIGLMAALAITGLACGGAAATPIPSSTLSPTPPSAVTPTPTIAVAPTPVLTPSLTPIPDPTQVVAPSDEVKDAFYRDSSGLFSVPIPANWTVEGVDGYGILTAPDGDLFVHVLAVEGSDVKTAIDDAWALVDPEFDLEPRGITPQPATGGL